MQHSVVQRFTTGIIGWGADAGSTAVSQSAPEQVKTKQKYTSTHKILEWTMHIFVCCQQAQKWSTIKSLLYQSYKNNPPKSDTDLSKNAARRRLSSTLWRVPALTWQFMSWAREMNTEVPFTSSSFSAGSPSSYSFGWQRFPIWLMSSAGSDASSCRDRPPLPPRPPPESGAKSGRASTRSPTTEEGKDRVLPFFFFCNEG